MVTRPAGNQGGVLEEGLQELIADIRELGVVVDLRTSMHEKFAIIDNTILWHGSLNILSHRDTSESMLRIPSSAACSQIAQFVTSPVRRRVKTKGEEVDLGTRENPDCLQCSRSMMWKRGQYGIYFECVDGCGGRIDPNHLYSNRWGRSSTRAATGRVCPRCGSLMTRRTGRHGLFFGCTRYPQCCHTEPIQGSSY